MDHLLKSQWLLIHRPTLLSTSRRQDQVILQNEIEFKKLDFEFKNWTLTKFLCAEVGFISNRTLRNQRRLPSWPITYVKYMKLLIGQRPTLPVIFPVSMLSFKPFFPCLCQGYS